MKVKWKGNFQEKCFENLGIPHEVVLFPEFMQIPNFLLSASQFFWLRSQQRVGHLMQGWRAFDKRNTLEPFYLYVGKY